MFTRYVALAMLPIGLLAAVPAQAGMVGFQSPSGNIQCAVGTFGSEPPYLTCEILELTSKIPPRPADCEFDWGQRFSLEQAGYTAKRECYSDTIRDDYPVLGYGKSFSESGFSCSSAKTGVTCENEDGHGFSLSKGKQALY